MNLFIGGLNDIVRGRLVSGAFSNVDLAHFQINPNAHNEWLISSPQAAHARIRARLEMIVKAIDPLNPGSEDPVKKPFSVDRNLIGQYIQKHIQWAKDNYSIPLASDFKITFNFAGKTQTADIEFLAVEKKGHVGDLYVKIKNTTDDSYLWSENQEFMAGVFEELNRVHGVNIEPFSRAESGMQANDLVCFEPSKTRNADYFRLIESLGFIDLTNVNDSDEVEEEIHSDYPKN